MKIIFNCHTEYDLDNQQSFTHLPVLLAWFRQFNSPITFSLAVGGLFQNRLLKYSQELKFPEKSELAIHFHSSDYQNYLEQFKEIFGFSPKTMVFGKWQIDEASLDFLAKQGLAKDGSWIDKEKIITPPFQFNGLLEIPAVSFRGEPLNPLTKLSHFFILRKIIKKHHQQNLILHLGFHSYDFFCFKGSHPYLRPIKKMIFKNILNLIKKYDLPIITLSQATSQGEELTQISPPLLARLFNLVGH